MRITGGDTAAMAAREGAGEFPGPVGTFDYELAFQGGFRVFKEGGEGLDDLYIPYQSYPEGELKSRLRISWVEIDTTLDEIDVARVHFIDPERRIAGYVAEAQSDPAVARFDVWKVVIGYHFLPESKWVSFTGIPVIEDVEFPRDGPPEVTVRLFAPSIAMARRNSALPAHVRQVSTAPDGSKSVGWRVAVYKSRHWCHDPYSIRRALEEMARAYSLRLELGSLGQVLDAIDDLYALYAENPTKFRVELVDRSVVSGPLQFMRHSNVTVFNVDLPTVLSTIERTAGYREDVNDWQYLVWLRGNLQKFVNAYFKDEGQTGGIMDSFFSNPKNGGNTIVFGIRDSKLYFCRLRDLDPRIDEITLFSYQCLDHSLLSFRVITDTTQGGADAAAGLARILALRDATVEPAETDHVETDVQPGKDNPEVRYDVERPTDNTILRTAGNYSFRSGSTQRLALFETATEEEILGMLATNLEAEAEVVGAPFLCAGKLVATYGLGVTGETKPAPEIPQRLNVLDRVWFVVGCTHRVDSSGLFTTSLRLRGAATDDSTKVPPKIAAMLKQSLERTGQKMSKDKTFWERLMTWDWGSGD